MPRGDKSAYTSKQKRKARHIEEGYEERGVPEDEAERRAWATVNKESGGGKTSGSGRGKKESHVSSRKGGRLGGKAAASRPKAARSRSAKKRHEPGNGADDRLAAIVRIAIPRRWRHPRRRAGAELPLDLELAAGIALIFAHQSAAVLGVAGPIAGRRAAVIPRLRSAA